MVNQEILRESAYQKARNEQMQQEINAMSTWQNELKKHMDSLNDEDENACMRRKKHYEQVLGPEKGKLFSPSPAKEKKKKK